MLAIFDLGPSRPTPALPFFLTTDSRCCLIHDSDKKKGVKYEVNIFRSSWSGMTGCLKSTA